MRLRIVVVPKLHNSCQLRLQVLRDKGGWDTRSHGNFGRLEAETLIRILAAGCQAECHGFEVVGERRWAA